MSKDRLITLGQDILFIAFIAIILHSCNNVRINVSNEKRTALTEESEEIEVKECYIHEIYGAFCVDMEDKLIKVNTFINK